MVDFPERRKEVSEFFPACPLCQKKTIVTQFCYGWSAKDYIFCSNCRARWHLNFLQGLKLATLIGLDTAGKGKEYYRIKYEPTFWYDMVQDKPVKKVDVLPPVVREVVIPPSFFEKKESVKEKEIVKETKVIVKIKCQYCGKRYDEILDVCPHCGGKS